MICLSCHWNGLDLHKLIVGQCVEEILATLPEQSQSGCNDCHRDIFYRPHRILGKARFKIIAERYLSYATLYHIHREQVVLRIGGGRMRILHMNHEVVKT